VIVIFAILPATHEDGGVGYCIEFCMQEVGMRYLRPMGKPILLRPVGKPIGDYCEAQVAMNV
jgi:hypothetical protein